MTKPFSLEELIVRVRAVLRRTKPDRHPARLIFADLEIDDDAHTAPAPPTPDPDWPNTSARVFERFYRSERARGGDIGGSGLGLSIAESVTTAHGGNAIVTSERGHGTTVRITLPRPPEHQGR